MHGCLLVVVESENRGSVFVILLFRFEFLKVWLPAFESDCIVDRGFKGL